MSVHRGTPLRSSCHSFNGMKGTSGQAPREAAHEWIPPKRSRVKHDNQDNPCFFSLWWREKNAKNLSVYLHSAGWKSKNGRASTYEITKSRTLRRAVTTNFLGFAIKPLSVPVPLLASVGDQPVPHEAQPSKAYLRFLLIPRTHSFFWCLAYGGICWVEPNSIK